MALKITKRQMLEVLIDAGLSPIEAERTFDSQDDFRLAIADILDKSLEIDIGKFKDHLVGEK